MYCVTCMCCVCHVSRLLTLCMLTVLCVWCLLELEKKSWLTLTHIIVTKWLRYVSPTCWGRGLGGDWTSEGAYSSSPPSPRALTALDHMCTQCFTSCAHPQAGTRCCSHTCLQRPHPGAYLNTELEPCDTPALTCRPGEGPGMLRVAFELSHRGLGVSKLGSGPTSIFKTYFC